MAKPNAFVTYPALVGSILAALRKQKDPPLTQQQIAEGLGVSVSTWSRIETGETALTVEQLAIAASLLGTSPGPILGAADIKLIELSERGIATTWQREEPEGFPSSLIQLTGASLARSIGFVEPAGITSSSALTRVSELIGSTKEETVRVAYDIGKRASEVGGMISDHAGRLTGEATRSVREMLEKTARSKPKKT